MNIGQNIRLRRKQLKMTQEELALEVNSDAGNLSRIENGKQNITLDKVTEYAKALKCSPSDLLIGKNEQANLPQGFIKIPLLQTNQVKDWNKIKNHLVHISISEWIVCEQEDMNETEVFAYKITDNRMLPEIKVGDLIILNSKIKPVAGDIVIASSEKNARNVVVSKYQQRGFSEDGKELFNLCPVNNDYDVISSWVEKIEIIGIMIEHRKYRT